MLRYHAQLAVAEGPRRDIARLEVVEGYVQQLGCLGEHWWGRWRRLRVSHDDGQVVEEIVSLVAT